MFNDFKKHLQNELNRSPHTIAAYVRDVMQFAVWLTGTPDGEDFKPESVTTSDIRTWIGFLAKQNSPSTLRRKAQSIRAYFHWLLQNRKIAFNPTLDITLAKIPKRLPEYISEEELYNTIYSMPTKGNYKLMRARIVLLLLYSTGLRQEELRMLTDISIHPGTLELKVTGKRNKQRIVPIAPQLMEEIMKFQNARDFHYPNLQEPKALIAGASGHIGKTTLYNIVHEALAAISANHKSPHLLRHTFATSMLRNGASINAVKEFLGHSSLSTTQIYTHLSFNELKSTYEKSHPRSTNSFSDIKNTE